MAQHKHWPADHPMYEQAPWCDLPTKKACDERWREKRGEAVRFSKENWVALEFQRKLDAATAGARADEEYARRYAVHVEEILRSEKRQPSRRANRRHPLQAVRLPRKSGSV